MLSVSGTSPLNRSSESINSPKEFPVSPHRPKFGVRVIQVQDERSLDSPLSSLEGWGQDSNTRIGYRDEGHFVYRPNGVKKDGLTWYIPEPPEAILFGKSASIPHPSGKVFGDAVAGLSHIRAMEDRQLEAIAERLTRSKGFLVPPQSRRLASSTRKIRGPKRPLTAGSEWPIGNAVRVAALTGTRTLYEAPRGVSNRPSSALPSTRPSSALSQVQTDQTQGMVVIAKAARFFDPADLDGATEHAGDDLQAAEATKIALRVIEVRLHTMSSGLFQLEDQRPATSSPRFDDWRPSNRPRTSPNMPSSAKRSSGQGTPREEPLKPTPREGLRAPTDEMLSVDQGGTAAEGGAEAVPGTAKVLQLTQGEDWHSKGASLSQQTKEKRQQQSRSPAGRSLSPAGRPMSPHSPPSRSNKKCARPSTAPEGRSHVDLSAQAIEKLRVQRIQRQQSKMLGEADRITQDLMNRFRVAQDQLRQQTTIDMLAEGVGCVRTKGDSSHKATSRGGSRCAHSIKWWVSTARELADQEMMQSKVQFRSKKGKQINKLFLPLPEK